METWTTLPPTEIDLTRRRKHRRQWTISGGQSTILYLVFTWAKGGPLSSSNNKDGINDTVVGDVVIVHDDKHPHGLWKLGSTEKLLPGADGNERVHLSRYNQTDALATSRDHFNNFIL